MTLPDIPAAAVPLVSALLKLIFDFISAGDDTEKQEAALMAAEARIARERAYRKFRG